MYTPHVVTLYNVWEGIDGEIHYGITILKNVMLQNSKADNVNKSGLTSADAATLFIPFDVHAVSSDGDTKAFLKPKEFMRHKCKERFWTLFSSGSESDHDCFFVKSEVVSENGYAYMREHYDDVYKVTSVDIRDFGSMSMRHWQVGAR